MFKLNNKEIRANSGTVLAFKQVNTCEALHKIVTEHTCKNSDIDVVDADTFTLTLTAFYMVY